jgi:hypothetical protein
LSAKRVLELATLVTEILFPTFQIWTRDFSSRAGIYPQFLAKEFATELAKAGLSENDIRAGIEKFKSGAADKPWMPNPAEFVEMCKDIDAAGITGTREAYQEACKFAGFLDEAKWTHPAVYVAGKATGWFDLRNKPEKDTWPIFKLAYKEAVKRATDGEDLSVYVPCASIENRSVFKAPIDTPNRLKALELIRKGMAGKK